MRKEIILSVVLSLALAPSWAQDENAPIKAGNKNFKAQKYTEAEIEYRKGLLKNSQSFEANYNLGNALFRQQKYQEALQQYQAAVPLGHDSKLKLASALHNAGNALLLEKKVAESIEAYKQALKLNPNDNDTRYNLAFAQYLLKNQPPQQNQNQPQNQNQKQDQDKQQQEQQQQAQQNDAMSKEQAEQILQALMQDEKETMEKAKKQPKASRKGTEKNW
ncbi:MAG: tetratricopeptide repeat protein [Bacteroidales bacterium]|jgi:tetratricopeptide (TPR) repeat protein|nr:MAG: tetratricopeptide repeat protein [Paludibacter sp.]MCE1156390.1 tetratricopeptide repeat protein [Bacteroidales bacterium]OJX90750.1 MAG: hypothetical protein BGP01_05105 [Paludibacter sp. 47-17]